MEKGFITTHNVHQAFRFLLNLAISAVGAKYKHDALTFSQALSEAWQDYHRPHTSSTSEIRLIKTIDQILLTLINATTTLAAILTSEFKQQFMQYLTQNTT
jgi:hypothetical protein